MNDLGPNSHTPKKGGSGGQTEYFATPNRWNLYSLKQWRDFMFTGQQAWRSFDSLQEQHWGVWQPGERARQDEEHADTQVKPILIGSLHRSKNFLEITRLIFWNCS